MRENAIGSISYEIYLKDTIWEWNSDCQDSFERLKNSLIAKPILKIYDPKLPLHMFVDASQIAVGAVLKQPDKDNFVHPIAYHSRILKSYEQNYFITELECLVIIDTLDKFLALQRLEKTRFKPGNKLSF